MLSSLYSGISGLQANSNAISVVGNNIANSNTIGFKSSKATFSDLLYQSISSQSGTSQVGRGTTLATVSTNFAQGSFETTESTTDLAIGGDGFFIVHESADNETNYYTRAGQFDFDKNGFLTTSSGYILQGRVIDRATDAPSGVATDISISQEPSEPRATQSIGMAVNLQSNADWTGFINTSELGTTGAVTSVTNSDGSYPQLGTYSIAYDPATGLTLTVGTTTYTDSSAVLTPDGVLMDFGGSGLDITLASDLSTASTQTFSVEGFLGADVYTVDASALGTDGAISDVFTSSSGSPGVGDYSAVFDSDTGLLTLTIGSDTYTEATALVADETRSNFGGSGLDIQVASTLPTSDTTQAFSVATTQGANDPNDVSSYSSSITVYDSLGQSHTVDIYFRKASENSSETVWEWAAELGAADSATGEAVVAGTGTLIFNTNGTLISGGEGQNVSFNFSNGASANQVIEINFGSDSGGGTSTQYPIASTTNFQTQDGYAPGQLISVTVSDDGTISGHYSNGQIINLYQITLANFNNPNGLNKEGGNLYTETVESGVPYTNAPGTGALGKINSNSLEQSNVDLATEFVNLIVCQRGYQANSRVITTTDQMLDELMNIKR